MKTALLKGVSINLLGVRDLVDGLYRDSLGCKSGSLFWSKSIMLSRDGSSDCSDVFLFLALMFLGVLLLLFFFW